jgi:hypothetical protein
MAKALRPDLSSAFDAMLAHSKNRFDELYRVARPPGGSPFEPTRPLAGREAARPATPRTGANLEPDSPAARRLNERFGSDWRYEITEQTRDGNEAIVLGRLTFGRDNAVRTQFGRATISGNPLVAASGGVRFKVGGLGTDQDVRDAFRRAAEAALATCIDLI